MQDTTEIYQHESTPNQLATPQAGGIVDPAQRYTNAVITDGQWTSFPIVTMEDRKLAYALTHSQAVNLSDVEKSGGFIEIQAVAFKANQVRDKDGDIQTVLASFIATTGGEIYMSSSQGVARALMEMMDAFGLPSEWDAPIKVRPFSATTRAGMQFKSLEIVV